MSDFSSYASTMQEGNPLERQDGRELRIPAARARRALHQARAARRQRRLAADQRQPAL